MLSVRKAIAILRQLRIGKRLACGWIADGSNDESKCAWGVLQAIEPSKTGLCLRIAGVNVKTGKPVLIDKLIRRINWRISAAIVSLILSVECLPMSREGDGRINVTDVREIRTIVRTIRSPGFVDQGTPIPLFYV